MKFQVTIVGHGAEALEFLNDSDNSFFILFNENAPEELAEISVLHTISAVYKEPAPGDTMKIGDKEFKITAVGVEAPYTLRELGHCTVNFGGGEEAALPGCIMLEGSEKVTVEDLQAGTEISITHRFLPLPQYKKQTVHQLHQFHPKVIQMLQFVLCHICTSAHPSLLPVFIPTDTKCQTVILQLIHLVICKRSITCS